MARGLLGGFLPSGNADRRGDAAARPGSARRGAVAAERDAGLAADRPDRLRVQPVARHVRVERLLRQALDRQGRSGDRKVPALGRQVHAHRSRFDDLRGCAEDQERPRVGVDVDRRRARLHPLFLDAAHRRQRPHRLAYPMQASSSCSYISADAYWCAIDLGPAMPRKAPYGSHVPGDPAPRISYVDGHEVHYWRELWNPASERTIPDFPPSNYPMRLTECAVPACRVPARSSTRSRSARPIRFSCATSTAASSPS